MGYETERDTSKLRIINNRILSNMLDERPNYFSIPSTENITKSLSYEEEIREDAAKEI
jgi:hypothetical protein